MKIYLITSIIFDLLKHEKVSAKQLAEKHEVSTRTIYRYLDYLECAGVPTKTYLGKNGGIGIDKSFKLDTTYLNPAEKSYLKAIISQNPTELSETLCKKLNL